MDAEPVSGRREITVTPVTGVVADYEGLKGGTGRDIYFRPDRYQRSELGPVGIAVELTVEDERKRCEIVDVSQNGVAFVWPLGTNVEIGTILNEIVVKFDDHEAFRGEARVSSVRHEDARVIVGASLVDTLMNIEDVLHLRDVKAWAGGGESPGLGLKKAAWRTPGQERFKALVADLRLLLEDGREQLGELEAVLPWHVTHGDTDTPARDALIERVRAEFSSEVVQLSNDIDAALRLATRSERDALNEYSNRLLHPLLMQSPWMHRARQKPLGYAGDYELMNGLYGNHFSGSTLFAKAVNLAFVSTPAAVAVRTRKELMKQKLSEVLDRPGQKSARILSIAAGPAQEVYELLQERHELPESVEIVLYDQDKRALTFSYGRLKRLVDSKWKGQVKLLHLNDSIRHLLRDTAVFAGHGAFDLVYSVGLFDYLQMLTAVSLCRNLYSLVAPGGTLLVGNMVPSNPSRWFMELHLDWFLVYRERSEMLELARLAAPKGHTEILDEPTRVNPFVSITKE
ncbi:MAG TPA: class I SAM-dependent methyltransferase [Polyangiaceae bacterium]|nr:class I SAM-dependent methyltransferase [Polyangiaceae bacterium]